MALWVYAIAARTPGKVTATGVRGERVRAVAAGSLVAFVGEVSRLPRPEQEHLRRHDRVVRTLWRRSSALLPARFGTHARDLDELVLILQSRRAMLRRQLDLVRNRVQMTVRILDAGAPVRPHSTDRTGPSGAAYLRERARQAAAARKIPGFDPLRTAVRRWIRAERVERTGSIATVYHLVPRAAAATYGRALARGAAKAGLRVVVSGPWPPYAFADPWSL